MAKGKNKPPFSSLGSPEAAAALKDFAEANRLWATEMSQVVTNNKKVLSETGLKSLKEGKLGPDEDEGKKKTGIAGGLGMISGAASAVTGAFGQVVGASAKFVEALSPALMMQFNQAMRDLHATIGVALAPVIQTATVVLRQFAAILLPVMEQIRPAIQAISNAFLDILAPILDSFGQSMEFLADIFVGVADVLTMFTPLLKTLMEVFSLAQTVYRAVLSTIGGLISSMFGEGGGDMFKNAIRSVTDALQWMAKMTVLAAAHFAKFVGLDRFVTNLINALAPAQRRDATGIAAAQNVQSQTADSFAMMVSKAAAIATVGGPGAGARSTESWLEEVRNELQNLQEGGQTSLDRLGDRIVTVFREKIDELIGAARREAYGTASEIGETAGSSGGAAGLLLGGLIASVLG